MFIYAHAQLLQLQIWRGSTHARLPEMSTVLLWCNLCAQHNERWNVNAQCHMDMQYCTCGPPQDSYHALAVMAKKETKDNRLSA
jgi:hypothetical protein